MRKKKKREREREKEREGEREREREREGFNTGRLDRGPCWQPCRDLEVSLPRLHTIDFLASSGILLLDLPPLPFLQY